jgi:hypothetical protein
VHLVGDDWLVSGQKVPKVHDRCREYEVRGVGKSKDPLYPLSRKRGVLEERKPACSSSDSNPGSSI